MAQCGRVDCSIEPSWGILDPESFRLLLVPLDGNRDRAAGILGVELPSFDETTSVILGEAYLSDE
jgi:hypothetical protein